MKAKAEGLKAHAKAREKAVDALRTGKTAVKPVEKQVKSMITTPKLEHDKLKR